jgi:hypothetical protein
VQFLDGATVLGSVTLSGGSAQLTTSALSQGVHSITAVYSGDTFDSGSTSAVLSQTVKQVTPAALTSSPNPSFAGQVVAFTVTLDPAATGTVQFLDGSTVLATVQSSSGIATYNTYLLTQGSHQISAIYNGDSNFMGAQSAAITQTVNPKTNTTTAVTSSANPATTGVQVTFTATVTPAAATGYVQFKDATTVLATVALANGTAAFSTSSLTAGTHSIAANYTGDTADNASSGNLTQTIQIATTISVASSQNPIPVGASVTFTAGVTPSTATGTVQFLDGATVLGTTSLAGGSASFTAASLAQGTHSITAIYSGDANDAGSTSAVLSQAVKAVTALSLVSSLNPSVVGQTVTFTASLNPAATGTVQFLDGATVLATIAVASGGATYSTSTLAQGTHQIGAAYSGDSNYMSSQSAALTQTVNPKASTTTTLVSPSNPSPLGSPVSLTANVTPATATGTVQFLDGATVLGTATLSGGSAVFTATGLTQGTHSITAVYGGDALDNGSTSAVLSQAVKLSVSLAESSSLNPSVTGQTVTFTANVYPAAATGTIQFEDGSTVFATVTISSGSASYSTSTLALGAHTITALYSGDTNYVSAQSSYFTQTVNSKTTTTTTVGSSQNPAFAGAPVTLTATVSPAAATGTMQFLDGATVLGTATIASGSASLTTSTLSQGSHSITAVYSGDATNTTSTSAALTQTINAQAVTSVGLAASQNPIPAGGPVTFTASVNPGTATGTVRFLDGATVLSTATLQSGVAAFTTSSLTAGTHSITAVYSGDAGDAGSTSAALSEGVRVVPAFTLASSLNPSVIGQTVTFTANITTAATGSVQFLDGATVLATVPLSSGVASYSTSALAQGSHSISATYPGDATYWSGSAALTQTVNAKTAATVSLTSSANPSVAGAAITLTAALSPATATGSVQFLDGGTLIGTAPVVSGVASFSTSSLAHGVHSLTATYSGDATDTAATSGVLTQTVKTPASISLTSNPNPSIVSQSVSLTATVSPSTATGTVQFLDGATVLSTVTLSSGSAVYSTSQLTAGAHSLTAVYGGDSFDTSATSAVITQNVNVPAPAAPSHLTASAAGATQINLSWTASATSGVTYDVYGATLNEFTPGAANRLASGVSGTTFSATGLAASTAYYFRVTAVNAGGESSPTNQAAATTRHR